MRKLATSSIILFFIMIVVVGCSGGASQSSEDEEITLTASTPIFESAAHSKGMIAWAEELEKRTDGKVKVDISFGGVTLDAASTLEGLGDGVVDVAFISSAYNPSQTPLSNALQPIFLDDLAVNGLEVQTHLWETVPELREEWRQHNVEPVAWYNGSNNILMSNFEFDKLEDLKGKKIRGIGEADSIAMKNLGGIPVSISSGDAYGAVEKGTVDVVPFPPYALVSNKMAEVSKQVTDFRHNGAFLWVGIAFNSDVYNSLPDDVKQVIEDINKIPAEVEGKAYYDDAMAGLKLAREEGARIVQLSPEESARWKEAINPSSVWEPAIKAAEEAGYKDVREKIEEASKMLEEIAKKNSNKTLVEQFLELEEKGEI